MRLTERLGSGLQNHSGRFDSRGHPWRLRIDAGRNLGSSTGRRAGGGYSSDADGAAHRRHRRRHDIFLLTAAETPHRACTGHQSADSANG